MTYIRLLSEILHWPFRLAEQRRVLAALAAFDDRALADIGLARQDLRDATALALGADPTPLFIERARSRALPRPNPKARPLAAE